MGARRPKGQTWRWRGKLALKGHAGDAGEVTELPARSHTEPPERLFQVVLDKALVQRQPEGSSGGSPPPVPLLSVRPGARPATLTSTTGSPRSRNASASRPARAAGTGSGAVDSEKRSGATVVSDYRIS